MTFGGRRLLMEEDFDGRYSLMEDNIGCKRNFDGKQHWMEEELGWKTTFDGR